MINTHISADEFLIATKSLRSIQHERFIEYSLILECNNCIYKIEYDYNYQTLMKTKTSNKECLDMPLIEVSLKEVEYCRKSNVSCFLLKAFNHFWITKVPKDIGFSNSKILGIHQCAELDNTCAHFSAKSDANGGCPKIRDTQKEKRIEKYPWITLGYETFNVELGGCLVVCLCKNYTKYSPKIVYTPEELRISRENLYDFYAL